MDWFAFCQNVWTATQLILFWCYSSRRSWSTLYRRWCCCCVCLKPRACLSLTVLPLSLLCESPGRPPLFLLFSFSAAHSSYVSTSSTAANASGYLAGSKLAASPSFLFPSPSLTSTAVATPPRRQPVSSTSRHCLGRALPWMVLCATLQKFHTAGPRRQHCWSGSLVTWRR